MADNEAAANDRSADYPQMVAALSEAGSPAWLGGVISSLGNWFADEAPNGDERLEQDGQEDQNELALVMIWQTYPYF